MAKQKSLEQLRAEKEQVEKRLAQEQHKLERLENRKKYLEKGERQKRTHRLCNLGGTIESLAPEVKNLTRTEMTELMEHIFGLPEVQRAVRHMEIQSKQKQTALQTIRTLSTKMESVEQVADAEGMLSEVSSAADSMIYRLDVCFEHYPEFLKNPKIRQKVVGLLQKAKDYIVKLEGEFAYD